jgi:3-oxoacyl-[acyl-carrier protein] reductase
MQYLLEDKVCIVTGAGGGIGRACVELLVQSGNKVVLVDLNEQSLSKVIESLEQSGINFDRNNIMPMALSVSSAEDMQRMADDTLERFGRIDCLIACAGILRLGRTLKSIADTSLEEWTAVVETNLTGTFLSNRAVLAAMASQRQGDIINISSVSGRQGRPFDGPYSASKFGIIGFSESLAEEVSGKGIRVQTVLPDAVETALWDQNGPAALKPVNVLPPERVAEFILYMLALPRDTYMPNPIIAPMKQRRKKRKDG